MSRYRWRGSSIGAAPSRIMVGEMDVIVGEISFVMNVDAFLACFALDEEAVAADSPPVLSAETAVVVIAPVPLLPTSVHWSSAEAPPELPPVPLALGKGHGRNYGGPWLCESCSHVVPGGRKCDACGATHPKLLAARPSPRVHAPRVSA